MEKILISLLAGVSYLILAIVSKESITKIVVTDFFILFSTLVFFYKKLLFEAFIKKELQRFIMLVYFICITIIVGTVALLTFNNILGFDYNIITIIFTIISTLFMANISVYISTMKINNK